MYLPPFVQVPLLCLTVECITSGLHLSVFKSGLTPPPLLLVQAMVHNQKLTEPTPSVNWTRVLVVHFTVYGGCRKIWCTILKTKGHNMLQGFVWVQQGSGALLVLG